MKIFSKWTKMNVQKDIKCLFLDIGDVLLSNGWGHESRIAAANAFDLDYGEMQSRHKLLMATLEEGKLTLNEYLDKVIFYKERPFTAEKFQEFMFAQSTPDNEMLGLIRQLKEKYHLKIAVVSNEARELNDYRINKFQLNQFVDFFISSCFVHIRKPDVDIFRLALDIAHVLPENVLYIDDTQMFVDIARDLGIRSIHHTDCKSTLLELASLGLKI
jgi:putative hydrolase of the HAD superfamily